MPTSTIGLRRSYLAKTISTLILLYLVLQFVELRFLEAAGPYVAIIGFLVGAICFMHLLHTSRLSKPELLFSFIFLIISVFPGMTTISGDNLAITSYGLSSGITILAAYFMARHVTASSCEKIFAAPIFYAFFSSYIFYVYGSGDVFATGFFLSASYNLISAIFVFFAVLVILVYKDRAFQPALILFITVVTCFFLYARSSMAVGFMILLWWSIYKMRPVYLLLLLLLAFTFMIIFWVDVEAIYAQTKFARSGLDTQRWEMWSSYVAAHDWRSFLVGIDLNFVNVIKEFGGNPHNSFIRFHSIFGVFGLIFMLGYLLYLYVMSKLFFLGCLFLIVLRSSTDTLVLPGPLDFYLFLICLISLKSSKTGLSN